MKKAFLINFLLLILSTGVSYAQEEDSTKAFFKNIYYQWLDTQQDSTYIDSYTDDIAGRLIGVRKYNFFTIMDIDRGTSIKYEPNEKISIGVGVTARWFSIDVTFKSGLADENIESTSAFDFQGRLFSSKQYLELMYKYYFGYYLSNTSNLFVSIPDSIRERADIRSSYIGLEYMYAFNYGRFSFKAPFVYNEIQKKSAGSFVIGASFVSFLVDGDYSLIPELVQDDFNPKLSFTSLNTIHLSIDAGYMYSLVFLKNFYITLGAIPGIMLVGGDYRVDQREFLGLTPSLKFKTMNAIGYNARRFYTGMQLSGDIFRVPLDKGARVQIGHSKWRLFLGYRFKSLRGRDRLI